MAGLPNPTILVTLNHELTDAQKQELLGNGFTIFHLKSVNPTLATILENVPAEPAVVSRLAEALSDTCRMGYSLPSDDGTDWEGFKYGFTHVLLPVGSPMFQYMFAAIQERTEQSVSPVFSYSQRRSVDIPNPDGEGTMKNTLFIHEGFYGLYGKLGA